MIIRYALLVCGLSLSLYATVYDQYIVQLKPIEKNSIQTSSWPSNWTPIPAMQSPNRLGVQHYKRHAIVENKTHIPHQTLEATLKAHPLVATVEPVYPVVLNSAFNDHHYTEQTYLTESALAPLLTIPNRHTIKVAVIDTGIEWDHPDLDGQVLQNMNDVLNGKDDDNNGYIDDRHGANFSGYSQTHQLRSNTPTDEFGHGTHIAGIIGAKTNNQVGIVGLNPNIQILNIKFLNKWGRGNQIDAAYAIRYAVDEGARVINCSWGYFRYNQLLKDAIQYALDHDVIVVAAMGNSNVRIPEYPAAFDGVIAVGSVSNNDNRSGFSSYGDHIDFSMPGENIFSLMPDQSYGSLTGTSQSTAIVSGIIARVLSYNDTLSTSKVLQLLKNATIDLDTAGHDRYTGYGRINSSQLISQLNVSPVEPVTAIPNTTQIQATQIHTEGNSPNPVPGSGTYFSFTDSTGNHPVSIEVFDTTGHSVYHYQGHSSQGANSIHWDASNTDGRRLMRGIYVWVLTIETAEKTHQSRHLMAIQ